MFHLHGCDAPGYSSIQFFHVTGIFAGVHCQSAGTGKCRRRKIFLFSLGLLRAVGIPANKDLFPHCAIPYIIIFQWRKINGIFLYPRTEKNIPRASHRFVRIHLWFLLLLVTFAHLQRLSHPSAPESAHGKGARNVLSCSFPGLCLGFDSWTLVSAGCRNIPAEILNENTCSKSSSFPFSISCVHI